jgi:hypothetical protein
VFDVLGVLLILNEKVCGHCIIDFGKTKCLGNRNDNVDLTETKYYIPRIYRFTQIVRVMKSGLFHWLVMQMEWRTKETDRTYRVLV